MKKIYIYLITFAGACLLAFSGCNKEEPIPAYIHIDKISLVANPDGFVNSTAADHSEGSLSSKISDAWVYVDEQLVGCFELPVTFPVLAEGTHTVKIRAGIKVNGIAATRSPYPFYDTYTEVVNFQSGTRITLTPSVKYISTTSFAWMEEFESGTPSLIESPNHSNNDSGLVVTNVNCTLEPQNVFEDCGSGYVHINGGGKFEGISPSAYTMPRSGAPIFLEFNYRCNGVVAVGMYANTTAGVNQVPALYLNPSSGWNKAYVYLSTIVGQYGTSPNFTISIGMSNISGTDSLGLLLDNIKLVY